MKTLLKILVLVAALGCVAALVAGPDRIGAVVHQAHVSINQVIDENISDPVALRSQLRKLEKEYPDRLAAIRGDLAELEEQKSQLERERAVALRVVALAEADRDDLVARLERGVGAAEGLAKTAAWSPDPRLPDSHARLLQARLERIQHTILAYANRAKDAERDLGYLEQQEQRLRNLLAQLEAEHAQFRAQLLQLDRQVDAVARNDRLIRLMEKREKTIRELSRYEVGSLDQLQGRLAEIRSRQEARLEVLADVQSEHSYEDQARIEVELNGSTAPAREADWIHRLETPAAAGF
ncbi:MAG: hypothetical protein D6702_06495 [Planctomycetota bacterium]|nr:MAG: hypothetical protein D6702_06495 [Planctomycetota bacterium]